MTVAFDPATPAEPGDLKAEIAARTDAGEFTLTDEHDWVVPITEPAPGRIVLGTDFAAHLWREWEADLREAGFDFPTFATLTSYSADVVGAWANGDESWDAVVADLVDRVEDVGPTLVEDLSP